MYRLWFLTLVLSTFVSPLSAEWLAKSNDTSLEIDRETLSDFLAFQQLNIDDVPQSKRKALLENWYTRHQLVALAEQYQIEKTPEFQRMVNEFQQDLLAKLALAHNSKQNMPDFSARAQELYEAKKTSEYTKPLQLRVKQIVLSDLKQAESIHRHLQSGTLSFDEAIRKYSEETEKKLTQGDSFWFYKGKKPANYYKQAEQLTPQRPLSSVFSVRHQYFILQFKDQKPAHTEPFESVKPSIIEELEKDYSQTQQKALLSKIKQKFNNTILFNTESDFMKP